MFILDKYITNNDYIWLDDTNINHPGIYDKIKYFIHGCFLNKVHKYKYLDLRSKLNILKGKSNSMQNTLFEQIKLYKNNDTTNFTNTEKIFNHEIKNIFKVIEDIIKEYKNFIYFTNSPYRKFLSNYFDKRNKICGLFDYKYDDFFVKTLTSDEITKLDISVNHHIYTKKLDETSKIISQFELMSDFIKSSVDSNDQLMFKFFLVLINCCILLVDFYYVSECNT